MRHPPIHPLTRRQALARVLVSVTLGLVIAAAIVVHGISTSSAGVEALPPGSAASQMTALQNSPIDRNPPSGVQAGLTDGSATSDTVHTLGSVGRGDLVLYGAMRSNGGVCSALSGASGGVGTTCVDSLKGGISISASNAAGWVVYGFAADNVVAVDVIVDGKPQAATMLANAYALGLGTADLGAAAAPVVHHADGTAETIKSGLQAPPSA